VFKNLARYRSANNFVQIILILLNLQNNYVERLSIDDNAAKGFNIQRLSVLHSYFIVQTKLFSDLYLAKFWDISAKPFSFFYVHSQQNSFLKKGCYRKWFHQRGCRQNSIHESHDNLKRSIFPISRQLVWVRWVNRMCNQVMTQTPGNKLKIYLFKKKSFY